MSTTREPPISFRPSGDTRAQLYQRARSRGETVSATVNALIAERLPELRAETALLTALQDSFSSLTVQVNARGDAKLIEALPRRDADTPEFASIARAEVRERGGQRVIELAGTAQFDGARVLLAVVPRRRRVQLAFDPADLGPNLVPHPGA